MSSVFLEVDLGDGDEEDVVLDGERHVFGRARDCTVFLRTDRVSRHHFLLIRVGGKWIAEDLNSANGTWLNDTRIAAAEVRPGDVLRLGKTGPKLRVVKLDPPPPLPPPGADAGKRFLQPAPEKPEGPRASS